MKKCENKDCWYHSSTGDGCGCNCGLVILSDCPIYKRLYKKKVPEKIQNGEMYVTRSGKMEACWENMEILKHRIHQVIDYLQEKE